MIRYQNSSDSPRKRSRTTTLTSELDTPLTDVDLEIHKVSPSTNVPTPRVTMNGSMSASTQIRPLASATTTPAATPNSAATGIDEKVRTLANDRS